MRHPVLPPLAFVSAFVCVRVVAQGVSAPPLQTESDEYTRYELLAPETAQFRIVYEVTANAPGAKYYFNPIRKGSEASDEAVYDMLTGEPLKFVEVSGAEAKASGHPAADPDTKYIQVHLARPVPPEGDVRLRIDKTYKDAASYFREGDLIVFSRSLGIKRNAVVLPAGYALTSCNLPSQILPEPDGRIKVSFINTGPAAAPLVVKARPGAPAGPSGAADVPRLAERARQDREIVYFLNQPETHSFSLYHDYTESREGVDKYLNVVRAGSTVSNPSARILDTGEALMTETLKGAAITRAELDIGEAVKPETEVVVVRFPPVKKGQSVRLRISETYTDLQRYTLQSDELVWDRSLGRPRNAVVLPAGWYPTASSIPATVSETDDGRVRLDYVNPRPDEISVLLKARRRRSS